MSITLSVKEMLQHNKYRSYQGPKGRKYHLHRVWCEKPTQQILHWPTLSKVHT